MRLQRNQGSTTAPRFAFQCLACFRRCDNTENWWADLDGPAYQAYYCDHCGSAAKIRHDRTKGVNHG